MSGPSTKAYKLSRNRARNTTPNIPHMEWNSDKGTFERKRPNPPPRIKVEVAMMSEVHHRFGIKCDMRYNPKFTSAVADTGCQTTTAGIDMLKLLNIPKRFLIPTSHRILGITDTKLRIIGALLLRIKHNQRTTMQMVYISENVSGLYLSETACKELGIVDENFPDQHTKVNATKIDADDEDHDVENDDCECIPRSEPPDRPAQIPFPPTKENKGKLKNWLLENFKSSAFNTCTHQPLKEMVGEPMTITFKEEKHIPYAVHTPIRVPEHWKAKVKADIDRDVRLCIIEPVPGTTPTTWCARMVVTAKKNGKPRRTVDLQHLKNATRRITHFTPTPFEIVSVTPKNTRPYSMHGTGTTHSHYQKNPKMQQHSSLNGDDTGIAVHRKDTMRQEMPTRNALMKSPVDLRE